MSTQKTDYLVVGAGATALSFVDRPVGRHRRTYHNGGSARQSRGALERCLSVCATCTSPPRITV